MGGLFGVVSDKSCVTDLYFGTDYHSHLGTRRGGLALFNDSGVTRKIHDITNAQFRSKFSDDLSSMNGTMGIGVISDYEDQPLIIGSHLGKYAIATVGVVKNIKALSGKALRKKTHFSEMSGGEINPTELVATCINQQPTFEEGIRYAQNLIEGSCSLLILSEHGMYAARDIAGRTPIVIGKKDGTFCAAMETSSFPNLNYETVSFLGPGEIVLITQDGIEQKVAPLDRLQICSFLWVYYGYPSSHYENINVEVVRNTCGALLAENDDVEVDFVGGIPDSGTGHGIGYANKAGIPYARPFVKYTPTWPRSFMPQDQSIRDLVANMKLIPIKELLEGKRLLFCEDSIVRGTQLKDTVHRLFACGAKEVHMRPACPPLVYGCKFLNFSRSRSELDLAARRAIREIEGDKTSDLGRYTDPDSEEYRTMVDVICKDRGFTTLKYQRLPDLVKAIGLPKEKLCTYCWDGVE